MSKPSSKYVMKERASTAAEWMAAISGDKRLLHKKEPAFEEDDGSEFAAFAARERQHLLGLGINKDEEHMNAEINRRWELRGGRSAKIDSSSKSVVAKSNLETKSNVEKSEKEPKMHLLDGKLSDEQAATLGFKFQKWFKGKYLYMEEEENATQETKMEEKGKPPSSDESPSSKAAGKMAKDKSPDKGGICKPFAKASKAKPVPNMPVRKTIVKKERVNKKLADDADYWSEVAAGRLMIKGSGKPDVRSAIETLLRDGFGVDEDFTKSPFSILCFELGRQTHYETDEDDNQGDDEDEMMIEKDEDEEVKEEDEVKQEDEENQEDEEDEENQDEENQEDEEDEEEEDDMD